MRLAARGLALTVTTTLSVGVLAAPAVAASPAVVSSTPAAGSFVNTAPSGVSIVFDQAIATSSTISVSGPQTAALPCTKNAPSGTPGTTLSCAFTGGAASVSDGIYTVFYTANSTGSDPATSGSFVFGVDSDNPGDPTVASSNPVAGGSKRSSGFTYAATASEPLLRTGSGIKLFDSTQTQVATGTVVFSNSDSTMTVTPTGTLPEGSYTAEITLKDVAGRTPPASVRAFTVDNTAPAAPVISAPLPPANSANSAAFPVSGTGEPGAALSLMSGIVTVTTPVNGAGAWSTTIDVSMQPDGPISFSATQRDAATNTSPAATTQNTTKDTVRPRVSGASAAPTRLNAAGTTATVTGKVDNGTTLDGEPNPVRVSADDTNAATEPVVATGTAAANGNFTIPVNTASLSDGTITYSITSTDPSGNTSTTVTTTNTKDTVAPAVPVVGFSPATINNTNKSSISVAGTSDGNTVDIVVSDTDPATADLTFTATVSSGSYSPSFNMTGLTDGTITATVVARDQALNASPQGSVSTSRDVVAPALPTVAVDPSPVNAATQTSVTVSGTTNGDSVLITLSDGPSGPAADVTGTAIPTGGSYSKTFDISSLGDGSITVSARAGDLAGNNSPAASTSVTKDSVAPGQPASLSANPSPYLQSSGTLTVNGGAAPADSPASGLVADITVSDTDPDTPDLVKNDVAVSTGTFQTTFTQMQVRTLTDGALTVSARIRDAAQNVGPARTTSVMKNVDALALVSTVPTNDATVRSPAVISATYNENLTPTTDPAATRSTITVKNKNAVNVAGTSGVNGKTISFTPSSDLTEAGSPYTVTVHAVDAGDTADVEDNTFSFSIDSTPPATPTITEATDPVTPGNEAAVSVSGDAGETGALVTVTITDGTDEVSGGTTAGDGGGYAVTPIDVSSLDDGTLTVTARSVDGAGNQSAVSQITQITKDTQAPAKLSSNPTTGATVEPPASVSITFDEALGSGTIAVAGVTGTSSRSGSTVTFTPDEPFADGTYTATADVTDQVGNDGTGSTTFTVDDAVVATSTLLDPLPGKVTWVTQVTVSGQVTRGDDSVDFGSVAIRVTDSAGTRTVATVTPDAAGRFSTTYLPTENSRIAAVYLGDAENDTSVSATRTVKLKLSLVASSPQGKASKPAKIKGKVGPKQAGATVKVFEFTKQGRTLLGTVTTNAKGRFKLVKKLSRGKHKILVKVVKSSTYKGNKARLTAVRR